MCIKIKRQFDVNTIGSCHSYSFLNLASIGQLSLDSQKNDNGLLYYCDGFLLGTLISILHFKKIKRFSFDFTSLAHPTFDYCQKHDKRVFFVGGTKEEINLFSGKVQKEYSNLPIVGKCDGYQGKEQWGKLIDEVISLNTDVLIVSLGAGLQEEFMTMAKVRGFEGTSFSSGGFIRQTSSAIGISYYPKFINALGLRAVYRMYKEPHTIQRYLFDYPKNLAVVIKNSIINKAYQIVD